MRKCVAVVALLVALPLAADTAQRIREGTALYDAGKYEQAVAIFKAVLADEPANTTAAYELALTYHAIRDYGNCRALLEPRLEGSGPMTGPMFAMLGNCLDGAGENDRAIEVYRKGLELAPDDHGILFNLAISLVVRGEQDEARELLKKELRLRPDHGSGHLLLAQVFANQNFRAAAVAEYLRFLAVEPATTRSAPAAKALLDLLNLGVEKKGKKNITITMDPNAPKGEGDYSAWEMGIAMAAANRLTPEKKQTEFERVRDQVAAVVNMLIELAEGNDYTAQVNVPFFAALEKKGLLDAFAGISLLSLNLPGQGDWLKKNAAAVQAYQAWQVEGK